MVEDLDPRKRTASARMLALPTNNYVGLMNTIRLPPGIVLSISLNGGTPDVYSNGDSFISDSPKRTDSIPVTSAPDLSLYPFDRYHFSVYVILKFINTSDNNATSFVPFIAAMETRNPTFSFTTPSNMVKKALWSSMSGFAFSVVVKRTPFTKAFSIFIFIAMWVLTLFAVVHAVDLVFVRKHRPVTFDAPAFAATLLFALPAVRQVQPGVPDVGAVIDVVGFFWNMVLLVLVCCTYLTLIYAQHVQSSQKQERQQQQWQAWKGALEEEEEKEEEEGEKNKSATAQHGPAKPTPGVV